MKRQSSILIANVLLAALLCSLHHWVAIAKSCGDYSPFAVSPLVSSLTFDETYFYAPLAQRFMSLGQLPAEVDNYERRDSSAGVTFIPAIVLAGMGRFLGSLERSFIAADVLFPALAFGLLYAASQGLVERLSSRLLIAWCTLLIPWAPRTFFWCGYDSLLAAPEFTRTPQPEISFVLVLLASVLLARALKSTAKRRMTVAAGLFSALIVYSYYFYAIAWSMTLLLLLVLALFWGNWMVARRMAAILGIMVLGSLPFVVATVHGRAEGGETDYLARIGTYTHAARLAPLLCFMLGFLLIWKFGKRFFGEQQQQLHIAIFIVLLLAGLAGLNIQILSGYDAQHGHFWRRLILPVAAFLCECWLVSATERRWNRPHVLKGLVVATLISIVFNAAARQVYVGIQTADLQRASRPEIALLKWVQSHLPSESVIGTVDPDLILLIPAITTNFTYVPPGLRSLTPTGEIVDRYYELASLLGLSTAEVDSIAMLPAHHSTDSQLLWVLRVWGGAVPPPSLSHDREDSQLSQMSTYSETRRMFSEGYRRCQQVHVDRGRRLDYVVSYSGSPIPAPIETHFRHARVVYANQRYQLIALQ
jgi:hypothetical protein